MDTPTFYPVLELRQFAESIFQKIGCSEKDAQQASDVLIEADLRGIDSHGLARMIGYIKQWEIGSLNPNPQIKVLHERPSTARIDGDKGLGLIVSPWAMDMAIRKAKDTGSAWVAACNSGHFGIAGYHAMLALEEDMIGVVMTHAASLAAPTFSREMLLGTNPIAMAVPSGQEAPFVADFATTTVAYGKLQIRQRNEEQIPLGWAQDAHGQPSPDPYAPAEGGALTPLGSDPEHSSHKGYCLGAMVDILSGVLSGANFGPWVPPFATSGKTQARQPPVGQGTGHFFGAMRIDAFMDGAEFKSRMDQWIRTFREAKAVEGQQVLIPGDPERQSRALRMEKGIPLHPRVVQDLLQVAQKLDLPEPKVFKA